MRKLLIAGMLSAALIGCGDDEEPGGSAGDAGTMDGGGEGGSTGNATGNQTGGENGDPVVMLENGGEACESDDDCRGEGAICRMTTNLSTLRTFAPDLPAELVWEGGNCSADCTQDSECGEGNGCLLGSVVSFLPAALASAVPAACAQLCEADSDCRDGYVCNSVMDLVPEDIDIDGGLAEAGVDADAGAENPLGNIDIGSLLGDDKYCLPEPPEVTTDAGTDASTDADASADADAGTDAGEGGTQ